MRLIDADALIDDIKNNLWDWKTVDGITATTVLKQTISDIGNQPVIEERKTGEWIKMSDADGYYYCCNKCGEELPRYTTELPSWDKPYPHKQSIDKTDFCPNCGADMRGEEHGQDD